MFPSASRRPPYFNPLPPQGGRPLANKRDLIAEVFQSTPSPRRETIDKVPKKLREDVFQSTPSPRRETPDLRHHHCNPCNFNPLPPQGGRLMTSRRMPTPLPLKISIHSLPKEGDSKPISGVVTVWAISIHSLPKEGDSRSAGAFRRIY